MADYDFNWGESSNTQGYSNYSPGKRRMGEQKPTLSYSIAPVCRSNMLRSVFVEEYLKQDTESFLKQSFNIINIGGQEYTVSLNITSAGIIPPPIIQRFKTSWGIHGGQMRCQKY